MAGNVERLACAVNARMRPNESAVWTMPKEAFVGMKYFYPSPILGKAGGETISRQDDS